MTAPEILILFNIVVLEALLSVDNAAVLAVMVSKLPTHQQKKALRYGLLGAYLLRGASLFVVGWLIQMHWLKIVGGLYLVYLSIGHFTPENDTIEESISSTDDSRIFKWVRKYLGINVFWSTVILVEIMDLVFAVDNVFAAVAMTNKMWLIMVGVFIGILAMRLIAGYFVTLMQRFPTLANSAYIVIGLLGLKLVVVGIFAYIETNWNQVLTSHWFDLGFSVVMITIFLIPLIQKKHHGSKTI